MNKVTLVGGEVLYNPHSPDKCAGKHCTIHRPSNHHMREWPQHWRADRRIMERICPCGVGHPDPDEVRGDTTHGCCGCCVPPETENEHPRAVA